MSTRETLIERKTMHPVYAGLDGGGANFSEFRKIQHFSFHETKRGEFFGICLFLKVGANFSEIFKIFYTILYPKTEFY